MKIGKEEEVKIMLQEAKIFVAEFSADRNSDADILIISNKKIELPFYLLPNKIHEIKLSEDNFIKSFEKEEILIKKIEENHVILSNHSFFVNLMWRKYAK